LNKGFSNSRVKPKRAPTFEPNSAAKTTGDLGLKVLFISCALA